MSRAAKLWRRRRRLKPALIDFLRYGRSSLLHDRVYGAYKRLHRKRARRRAQRRQNIGYACHLLRYALFER